MLVEHAQRQDEDEQIAAAARVCAYIFVVHGQLLAIIIRNARATISTPAWRDLSDTVRGILIANTYIKYNEILFKNIIIFASGSPFLCTRNRQCLGRNNSGMSQSPKALFGGHSVWCCARARPAVPKSLLEVRDAG